MIDYLGDKYVTEVSCGWSHSVILIDPSYLYSTGCGMFGETG